VLQVARETWQVVRVVSFGGSHVFFVDITDLRRRALQVLDQMIKLACDLFCVVAQFFERVLIYVAQIFGDAELAADFASGGFGLAEVVNELALRSALEAFRYIGHNAHGGALDLVAEAEVLGKGAGPSVLVDRICQRPGGLPDSEVFDVFRHDFSSQVEGCTWHGLRRTCHVLRVTIIDVLCPSPQSPSILVLGPVLQ